MMIIKKEINIKEQIEVVKDFMMIKRIGMVKKERDNTQESNNIHKNSIKTIISSNNQQLQKQALFSNKTTHIRRIKKTMTAKLKRRIKSIISKSMRSMINMKKRSHLHLPHLSNKLNIKRSKMKVNNIRNCRKDLIDKFTRSKLNNLFLLLLLKRQKTGEIIAKEVHIKTKNKILKLKKKNLISM
jgi:hypothetical protein